MLRKKGVQNFITVLSGTERYATWKYQYNTFDAFSFGNDSDIICATTHLRSFAIKEEVVKCLHSLAH